jgi:hypothetical protein
MVLTHGLCKSSQWPALGIVLRKVSFERSAWKPADRQEVLANAVEPRVRQEMANVRDSTRSRVLNRDHSKLGFVF